jgi:hypothetical protein
MTAHTRFIVTGENTHVVLHVGHVEGLQHGQESLVVHFQFACHFVDTTFSTQFNLTRLTCWTLIGPTFGLTLDQKGHGDSAKKAGSQASIVETQHSDFWATKNGSQLLLCAP